MKLIGRRFTWWTNGIWKPRSCDTHICTKKQKFLVISFLNIKYFSICLLFPQLYHNCITYHPTTLTVHIESQSHPLIHFYTFSSSTSSFSLLASFSFLNNSIFHISNQTLLLLLSTVDLILIINILANHINTRGNFVLNVVP